MLTLSSRLRAELYRADPDVRRLVTFTLAVGVDETFCDGGDELFDYPPSVLSTKPSGLSLDVFTREIGSSESEIVMRADGVARALVVNNRVRGKLVTIRIGTVNTPEADFVTEWRGIIDKVSPARNGEVTFTCKDGLAYLADYTYTGGWIGYHPLTILGAIFSASVPSDLYDADSFDADDDTTRSHWNLSRWEDVSLTWTTDPLITEQIGHANSFYKSSEPVKDGLFSTPRVAIELVQELLQVLGGTLRHDSLGRLAYAPYDAAAAAVAHLTPEADYTDWDQPGDAEDIATRVTFEVSIGSATANSPFLAPAVTGSPGDPVGAGSVRKPSDQRVVVDNAAAQTDLRPAGSSIDRIIERTLKSDWLRCCAQIIASGADLAAATDPATLDVSRATALGLSGARFRDGFAGSIIGGLTTSSVVVASNVATAIVAGSWLTPGAQISTTNLGADNVTNVVCAAGTDNTHVVFPLVHADGPLADQTGRIEPQQRTIDTLASGREAYLLLLSPADETLYEIVKATAGVPTPGVDGFYDARGVDGAYVGPESFRYTVSRAQLGTTAQTFPNVSAAIYVWDITIAVERAQTQSDRFGYGVAPVSLKACLAWLGLQIGDFVTHDAEMFLAYGIDGATSADVFEIVGKVIDKDASPPAVALDLRYVRSD